MRVFLSYASEQRDLAEELAQRLKSVRRIDVFFDRESLIPGDPFDLRIRRALARADVFVFLASPDSLRPGAYTLTELGFAQKQWPRATGRILTVLVGDTAIESLPNYLRSVSVLHPEGDVIAETVAAVSRLAERKRRVLWGRLAGGGLVLVALAVLWTLAPWTTNPYEIKEVSVTKIEEGFRFTATLRNAGPEAVTTVNLYPEADISTLRFSGSMEWFQVGSGEEKTVSVVQQLTGTKDDSRFNWRLCWVVVKTLDLDMAKDIKPIERFVDQRSQTVCSPYRHWLNMKQVSNPSIEGQGIGRAGR
jgi:hypothetical protein